MPEAWEIVPSEIDPMEQHLLVRFSKENLRDSLTNVQRLVSYADIDLPVKPQLQSKRNGKELSTFLLSTMRRVEANWLELRFVPPKSDLEKEESPFLSTPSNEPNYWHPVINKPQFLFDQTNPRVGEDETGPIYMTRGRVRFRKKEGLNAESPVLIEEWISPTPWRDDQLVCIQPQPLVVDLNWYGDRPDIGSCLHPKFIMPAQGLAARRPGGGTVLKSVALEERYPATIFEDWAPFKLRDEVSFIRSEGVYHRVRMTIYPPHGGVERWYGGSL